MLDPAPECVEASRLHKIETERAAAAEIAAKLESILVKIAAPCGADERLYGSITAKDIAEALKAQHGIEIDRRKLQMKDPIKTFGTHSIDIKLYPEITGKVNIVVAQA